MVWMGTQPDIFILEDLANFNWYLELLTQHLIDNTVRLTGPASACRAFQPRQTISSSLLVLGHFPPLPICASPPRASLWGLCQHTRHVVLYPWASGWVWPMEIPGRKSEEGRSLARSVYRKSPFSPAFSHSLSLSARGCYPWVCFRAILVPTRTLEIHLVGDEPSLEFSSFTYVICFLLTLTDTLLDGSRGFEPLFYDSTVTGGENRWGKIQCPKHIPFSSR